MRLRAVRLVLFQTGRDGVCAPILVVRPVLITLLLHDW